MTTRNESSPSQATAKWGQALDAGYQILPDALIRGQSLLQLSATDLVVLVNITQAWWYAERVAVLEAAYDRPPHGHIRTFGPAESEAAA